MSKNLTAEGVVMLLRSIPRYDCSISYGGDIMGVCVDDCIDHTESPDGLYILYEDIADLIAQIRRTSANDPHLH